MAMKKYLILSILLLSLICFNTASSLHSKNIEEEEEDLSFLEEEDSAADAHSDSNPYGDHHDYENYDDLEEDSDASDQGYDSYEPPAVDEKDVAVLKEGNFSEFIAKNKHVMVEFYAPWCGHCQALAPEYAAAATELKGENVLLAKVDATEEAELAQKYDVQGYPAVFFFIDGLHKPYNGERNKDAIVSWIKKKTGPALSNITTAEEAERVLKDEKKVVLAYLNDLVGDKSEELAAAAALEDDVNFYQTASPDVAKLFHIDSQAKRPALVIIKKEAENINHFGGEFTKSAIAEFVFQNKLPLVTYFTRESASEIFENAIKKQLILFATSKDSDKFLPIFQEAVKAFKGKLISVYVEIDNEDVGKPVSEYFGVSGDAPRVLAYTGNEDGRKFVLEGEITLDSVKSFGEKFLLKCPLKPQLPYSILLLKSSFSAASLAVDHPEPPPTTTTKIAFSNILTFFQTYCTKGSAKLLKADPCYKNLIFELNELEIEDIVEKLSVENSDSALEFFFLLRNDYGFKHSRVSHVIVAHVLAKKQRFRALKFHLQNLVQEEGSGSASLLSELLSSRFQKWDSNHVVWDMLASAYSQCQMVLDALFVFAKMKNFNIRASIILYNNLLYKLRDTDIIRDVYDDIKASGINPSEYTNSILIDGLCKQFSMQEAVEFLRGTECREFGPCVVSFNTLMSSSCKMGYMDVAKSFFCMMFKYGLHLNVYSYNILIHGLSMAGAMEEALEFKGDMEKHGLQPNVVTYNVLTKGFCLLGMTSGVWTLINEMLHKGLNPDIVTFKMLICGYCKAVNVDEGIKLGEENSGHKPDTVMYSILIQGLCKKGLVELAFQLYRDMCYKRILPNIVAHRSILKSFCEKGYMCEARAFFDALMNCDLMDDVLLGNIMIDGYAKRGDIGEALQVYELIKEKGIMPSIVTFNSLLYGFCKARKLDDARKLFDTIVVHGLIPTEVTYTTLMDAYSEEGNIQTILELQAEMKARGMEPTHVTRTVIMKCHGKTSQMHESVRILKNMLTAGPWPDEVSYNTIIQSFCKARDMKGAIRLHDEMIDNNLLPSRVTYNILLNGLCVHGDLKYAEKLFSSLEDRDVGLMKCDYTILIKAHCAKGDVNKAVGLFKKMIEKGFEISIRDYSAVINRLCKRNLLYGPYKKRNLMDDVKDFLHMMLSHGISVDLQMYSVMLNSFRRIGDHNSVFQLFSLKIKCGLDTGCNCG